MTKMLDEIFQQPAVLGGIESANKKTLTALVEDLNARKISHALLAARGSSDHAAVYGKYLLGVYKGVVSGLAMPSVITSYDSKPDMSQDLVIGISQSGRAADAIAVLETANSQGGITVAITNNLDSPLAKIAKYHLYCNAGLEESVAATKTFTAQLYLLALLTAYWSADEQLLESLRKLPESLKGSIDSINASAASSVAQYRYITDGFVLARGFCYPIAMEMALKVQETCYVKMQGHAISDFYHGPMAQVTPDVPVIVIAPTGKSFKDAEEVIEKITAIGSQILIVTDDKALAEKHDHSVLLPAIDSEPASALLYTVFAQCFAQSLSISKGLNPDSPRLLKKVTITK
ncbi:MAG TPA: SIS domain-containing protein [Clostridia bacterium]|nr:SIS domain-containing protein [Clostridia bacterium]